MKICMITTTYPRFEGDTAAPFIASIAEGVAALGHSVDVVLPFHPKLQDKTRNGVNFHPYHVPGDQKDPLWGYAQSMEADVKVKKKAYLLAPLALHRTYWTAVALTRHNTYDLIHAHWVLPNGFPAALLARRCKLPLTISLHGSDMFLAQKGGLLTRAALFAFRQARSITACSPDLQGQARKLSGKDVNLLEYGVDVNRFAPSDSATLRPRSIFAVGRLVYKKGFVQLLEAFSRVIKYYTNSTLNIAGDGPLLQKLKDTARKLGIESQVTIVGNIARDQLPELYRSAEIVVVPSITDDSGNRDGLPNVFLEALSSGCAVIASDIPGMKNLIRNREAFMVSSGDVSQLSNAILELFKNPSEIHRLRKAAREMAVKELSWTVRNHQLESLYKEALR